MGVLTAVMYLVGIIFVFFIGLFLILFIVELIIWILRGCGGFFDF